MASTSHCWAALMQAASGCPEKCWLRATWRRADAEGQCPPSQPGLSPSLVSWPGAGAGICPALVQGKRPWASRQEPGRGCEAKPALPFLSPAPFSNETGLGFHRVRRSQACGSPWWIPAGEFTLRAQPGPVGLSLPEPGARPGQLDVQGSGDTALRPSAHAHTHLSNLARFPFGFANAARLIGSNSLICTAPPFHLRPLESAGCGNPVITEAELDSNSASWPLPLLLLKFLLQGKQKLWVQSPVRPDLGAQFFLGLSRPRGPAGGFGDTARPLQTPAPPPSPMSPPTPGCHWLRCKAAAPGGRLWGWFFSLPHCPPPAHGNQGFVVKVRALGGTS